MHRQAPCGIDTLPEGKRKEPGREIHIPQKVRHLHKSEIRGQRNRPIRSPVLALHSSKKLFRIRRDAVFAKKLPYSLQGPLLIEIQGIALNIESTYVFRQRKPLGIVNKPSGRRHAEKTKPVVRRQSGIPIPPHNLKEKEPPKNNEEESNGKKPPYVKAEIHLLLPGKPLMGHRRFPPGERPCG
jgi:hypothetical protein